MPTFTAIALETLLQPTTTTNSSSSNSSPNHRNSNNNNTNSCTRTITKKKKKKGTPNHIYITPTLYTTPEPAPIPYSSAVSVSPSPYVVNRKRRHHLHPSHPPPPEAANLLHGFEIKQDPSSSNSNSNSNHNHKDLVVVVDIPFRSSSDPPPHLEGGDIVSTSEGDLEAAKTTTRDHSPCDFFISGGEHSSYTTPLTKLTQSIPNQTEFFDADEEFLSDGSISNASPSRFSSIEELRAARVNLFDEIERRKRAEDALARMRNQWQGIKTHLSRTGLSLPANEDAGEDIAQFEIDMVDQFCQEVVVARFVSEAIGRGLARAETEAAAEAVVESKCLEISRLRDKLQYYEAVNHEMFQRNQEVVEITRKQRDRRKTKQIWIWRCIGLSITLGASLLAYSYLPEMSKNSPVSSADMSDVRPETLDSN